MSSSPDSFLARNAWIAKHPRTEADGTEIAPKYLLMKFIHQKTLLEHGRFDEAKLFGAEEGLHETAVYRLLGDVDVPQSTIIDRLEADKRMHIDPTNHRGSYYFQQAPAEKRKLIFDPQTIRQLFWHDKSFETLQTNGAKAAAELAREKELAHDLVCHFNHHRIYRRAIKHLDAALARMINDRENLGRNWRRDFLNAQQRHLQVYLDLEQKDFQLALKYAQQFNFAVFENGRDTLIRPIKSIDQEQIFVQNQIPTLFSTEYH